MSRKSLFGFRRISAFFLLGLLWLFSFSTALYSEQQGSSSQSSQAQGNLWEQLKTSIDNLPSAINAYSQSWIQQVQQLQSRNQLLTDSLEKSQASVGSLTKQNASLKASVSRSQQEAQTSSAALRLSQQALTNSIDSITKAQRQISWLRIGLIVTGSVAVLSLGYAGGHILSLW